jgi:prepilin-type N-terminal cleavage/methylation domain-containing protein
MTPRRGFTLVETIAVMAVLAAVGSVSSLIIYSSVNGYRSASARSIAHECSAAAMERLSVEFRQVPLDPDSATTAPLITSVTPTSIVWGSGSTLSLDGSNLRFVDGGAAAVTLLSNVSGFSVQCYNESNTALATTLSGVACQPIRRIGLTLTVSHDGQPDTIRSKFFIRSAMAGGAP